MGIDRRYERAGSMVRSLYSPIFLGFLSFFLFSSGTAQDDIINGKIAFIGEKDGTSNLYVVNADGSGLRKVTDDPEGLGSLVSIAPNGKKVVANIQGEIILFDLEDGSRKKLSSGPGYFPIWSPGGKRIAYTGVNDSLSYVCVMDTAGNGVEQLTEGCRWKIATTWGPKGEKIIFQGKGYDLWSVDAKASGHVHRLTHTGEGKGLGNVPVYRKIPSCSPDGKKISFHGAYKDDEKAEGLYRTDGKGKDPTLIRKGSFSDRRAWTSDSEHLLVSLSGKYENGLYLIDLNGEIVRKVLDFEGTVYSPSLGRGSE